MWTANIPPYSTQILPSLSISGQERKVWQSGTLQLGYFSLHLLTATTEYVLHPPSTRCMSISSINELPLSLLDQHGM
jgi:hypothetical protein